jgi:hypothetical protein
VPIAEVTASTIASAITTGTTAMPITTAFEVRTASQMMPPPMTATTSTMSPVTSPIPALPMICSPQVRLRRLALRLRASTGPTSSTTSTGTIRKVASDQAAPPIAARISVPRPPLLERILSNTPTVAEIAAQPMIFRQRFWAAAQPVSPVSGCPPNRAITDETRATLQ